MKYECAIENVGGESLFVSPIELMTLSVPGVGQVVFKRGRSPRQLWDSDINPASPNDDLTVDSTVDLVYVPGVLGVNSLPLKEGLNEYKVWPFNSEKDGTLMDKVCSEIKNQVPVDFFAFKKY